MYGLIISEIYASNEFFKFGNATVYHGTAYVVFAVFVVIIIM